MMVQDNNYPEQANEVTNLSHPFMNLQQIQISTWSPQDEMTNQVMHEEQRLGQESNSSNNEHHSSSDHIEVKDEKYSGSFGRKQEHDGTPSF